MEKDTRINYMLTRIVKLIAVELYCMHTVACVFYYLVTTLPQSEEGYTWIRNSKCWEDFLEKISHTEGGPLSIFENDVRISGVVDVHNFFLQDNDQNFFERKMQQKSHHPSTHHQNCRTNTPSTTFLHLHVRVDHLVIGTHSLWENQ